MSAIDRRQACPYCGDDEERESERDYPHWRQFGCGSLLISPEESDGVEQSQKCRVRQRDLMLAAAKEDFGNAMVRIAELEAKLDADGRWEQEIKQLIADYQASLDRGACKGDAGEGLLRLVAMNLTQVCERASAPPAEGTAFEFRVGEPVSKWTGDYRLDGIVVAAFAKLSGVDRYVVEDDRGMLLIYGPANLVSRADLTSGEAAQREGGVMIHLGSKAQEICSVLEEFGFVGVRVEGTNTLEDFDGDVEAHARWNRDYAAFVAAPRRPLSIKAEECLVEFVKQQVGEGVTVTRYPRCNEFEIQRKD